MQYFRQAGYFAAILILLPYVVTILLNGRSSLAQDNGTSPYVTVKSDEKNRKISLDEYGIGILAKEIEGRCGGGSVKGTGSADPDQHLQKHPG